MKTSLSSALAAFTLISSIAAIPSLSTRAIQRRNDAPPLPPCPSNDYTPYVYVGCFVEPNPETLQYNPNLLFSTMTVETCTATCKSNGFRYAGLIYYGDCLCGTMLPPTPAPESDCNAPCNGNSLETCGQNQRSSIWKDPTYPAVDLSTIVSDYASLGCYTEGTGYHAVSYRQNQLSSISLTTEECLTACGNEYYPLAATEFAGECYCGYMLQAGSVPAPATDCNMQCTGDSTEICGGPNRLNLYEAKILESTQPCGSNPPPPPQTCNGTAYGYVAPPGPGQSTTFISLSIGKNWGWVITGSTPPTISGTLYLGAGGNDISKATAVGSFTIAHFGSNLVVTYSTNAPWHLSSTHFYYDSAPPTKIAPGQFGNKHDGFPVGTTTDSFSIPFYASKTTYIVHAGIAYAC